MAEPGQPSGGPLRGLRVIELAGLGPGPFCAMLLADLGADVLRVERPGTQVSSAPTQLLSRGRRSVMIDLKSRAGAELLLSLAARADVLIEGMRPGAAERLGLGPAECHQRNPRLIYGRMTGWGQSGPLAETAGHDIDYIARTGALHMIGRAAGPPQVPLNLIGDFGGGGMLLAFGLVCALLVARGTGQGQVVDAAMVDGSALLMLPFFGSRAAGSAGEQAGSFWSVERGTNLLDSGAPFYDAYETADGQWVAAGAIEPQFYAELLRGLGLRAEDLPHQLDRDSWPAVKEQFARIFRQRTRAEWNEVFAGTDACVAPVLALEEVELHAHNAARRTFADVGGIVQPRPAPRLSVTPGEIGRPPPVAGEHTAEVLADWLGLDTGGVEEHCQALRTGGTGAARPRA